ncbi:Mov34/MPN/PAD-1 family: proteasomal regulatory protein rpn11 and signalosome complex protein (macronuclear) [Tetrahymena thermophila SB210]|uniref:Mov34/MPN/PAD-1 family: proteasomal regulatory protein rpn11 and signalosome complex protein n=1 Tax=Tetrahymena thermophila (strain SB210) TaxID=312017 RepID=I7MEL5_TETTS|nr:Mov34/MPN/PAD-1 family: proteasomal regulatory protein rpn11 and signalosome complex protein [Tetrahymena thermophila SB210]EAR97143.1 Mov34/MPN/PAD-1 family: proteasomal regulatory protein rpn11 and signalosome complex protein [Tetrahymena thermophila SB210]|eukprot:XP_001017388.1 Mov34/MPN/PAD-1 family: proteasomal regulatory protein rpn11 and signalosome complex protein [Tetrahymena thermophila SB210]
MNQEYLQQFLQQQGYGGQQAGNISMPLDDTSETIYISSLALLKMLKHSRAGVPLEVMGLMLGEIIDDYTVKVVDVFAMPQSGTGESVEAVDPVFQAEMLEMLKQTERNEMVVGWYHSHPGFGPWLSSVDMNTQMSFEQLHPRFVALVIDPIQSVKGKVVMDAFRLINNATQQLQIEARQTTSNIGHLQPPSFNAIYHGLNKYYYSININYRKNELETQMLLNLYKKNWSEALKQDKYEEKQKNNVEKMQSMCNLAKNYIRWIEDESKKTKDQLAIRNVGKIDPQRHLLSNIDDTMSQNIVDTLGTSMNQKSF